MVESVIRRIIQVDAFADRPFAGNPAAVCVLDAPAEERWMQAIAAEMKLSETAFLHPEDGGYRLRWFTPAVEVDLCGHATLASVHVLWEDGRLAAGETARFLTRSGVLTAEREGDWIRMDFPATPAMEQEPPPGLAGALGTEPVWSGRSCADWLLELTDEAAVRRLTPDFGWLHEVETRGVIVTARAEDPGGRYDFVSRFFAPRVGIDEDPVTGSAHCTLAPFWTERLGRSELVGFQASARGGVVRVRARGERVELAGQAVTVLRGELLV